MYEERSFCIKLRLVLHLACTLDSPIGTSRRSRTQKIWAEENLSPIYVFGKPHIGEELIFDSPQKKNLAAGQLGCYSTHKIAWNTFLETQEEFCLITEDDAILVNRNTFSTLLANLTQDYSSTEKPLLIQLGHVTFQNVGIKQFLLATIKFLRNPLSVCNGFTTRLSFGTHCYLINREMARFLSQFPPSGMLGLDVVLIHFSRSQLANDMVIQRRILPISIQERIDSSIPAVQDYKGRTDSRLTFREIISSISQS